MTKEEIIIRLGLDNSKLKNGLISTDKVVLNSVQASLKKMNQLMTINLAGYAQDAAAMAVDALSKHIGQVAFEDVDIEKKTADAIAYQKAMREAYKAYKEAVAARDKAIDSKETAWRENEIARQNSELDKLTKMKEFLRADLDNAGGFADEATKNYQRAKESFKATLTLTAADSKKYRTMDEFRRAQTKQIKEQMSRDPKLIALEAEMNSRLDAQLRIKTALLGVEKNIAAVNQQSRLEFERQKAAEERSRTMSVQSAIERAGGAKALYQTQISFLQTQRRQQLNYGSGQAAWLLEKELNRIYRLGPEGFAKQMSEAQADSLAQLVEAATGKGIKIQLPP